MKSRTMIVSWTIVLVMIIVWCITHLFNVSKSIDWIYPILGAIQILVVYRLSGDTSSNDNQGVMKIDSSDPEIDTYSLVLNVPIETLVDYDHISFKIEHDE